eukprot:m.107209 g.107209  ORF g.107209 m.107209 type:complete len:326 (-) comp15308_c0_seq3:2998-3975(-)
MASNEELVTKLAAANKRIDAQAEQIEELEDAVKALLCCYHDVQFKLSQLDRSLRNAPAGNSTTEAADASAATTEANAVEVPVYGSCFGYLHKTTGGIGAKSSKKRWVVLQDDGVLYYWKSVKASTLDSVDKGVIELTNYTLDTTGKFGFKMSHPTKRAYEFHAETTSDRQRWMVAIENAILRKQSSSPASVDLNAHRGSISTRTVSVGKKIASTTPAPELTPQLLESAAIKDAINTSDGGKPWKKSYACLVPPLLHVYESKTSNANSVTYDLKLCPTPPTIGSESGLFTAKLAMLGVQLKLGFASEQECNQWASALLSASQESYL